MLQSIRYEIVDRSADFFLEMEQIKKNFEPDRIGFRILQMAIPITWTKDNTSLVFPIILPIFKW